MKGPIRRFYFEIIEKIFHIFQAMNKESPTKFQDCLFPLMGFGNRGIVQAICFHGIEGGDKYHLKGTRVKMAKELEGNLKKIRVMDMKMDLSSFEVRAGNLILQIRVKPMNVFTTPAVKINCSVKEFLEC